MEELTSKPGDWPADAMEAVAKCPVCQSSKREVELGSLVDDTFFCASGAWTMMRCSGCRSTYLDPRPSESAIHLAYAKYYTHQVDERPQGWKAMAKHAVANSYRNRIFGTAMRPALPMGHLLANIGGGTRTQQIQQSDRGLATRPARGAVLDVGCGNGAFLKFARELGWKPFGVELDVRAARAATESGIDVLAASLVGLGKQYHRYFDAITLSHVIEHVHHPAKEIERCFTLLKPGGYLWVETPNIESFGFKLFGRYWRGVEAPRHLVLFNVASLTSLLQRAGFQSIETRPTGDSAPNLFRRSTMIRHGFRPDENVRKLSLAARLQLAASVYESRIQTTRDPRNAEFLCLTAIKPERAQGAGHVY